MPLQDILSLHIAVRKELGLQPFLQRSPIPLSQATQALLRSWQSSPLIGHRYRLQSEVGNRQLYSRVGFLPLGIQQSPSPQNTTPLLHSPLAPFLQATAWVKTEPPSGLSILPPHKDDPRLFLVIPSTFLYPWDPSSARPGHRPPSPSSLLYDFPLIPQWSVVQSSPQALSDLIFTKPL